MSHATVRELAMSPAPGECFEDPKNSEVMYDGELAELTVLYQELAPGLVRYLRRVLQNSGSLAEDIAQDAFLTLVRRWTDVRRHPQPKAWLYTVGRHLAIAALRERSREFLQEEPLDREGGGGSDPSDWYSDSVSVREAIRKLPLRQREAVWLFYFGDFKQHEIATIMHIQRETVGALLFQARGRLAELLSEGQAA